VTLINLFIATGFMVFAGIQFGKPLRSDYSKLMIMYNKLMANDITLNINVKKELAAAKDSFTKALVLDLVVSWFASIFLLSFYATAMRSAFSSTYLQLPFTFPWFTIDFPPVHMTNKLGWITLSITFSYIWSFIFSKLKASLPAALRGVNIL